jgi:ABC-2 type transport system permease protein
MSIMTAMIKREYLSRVRRRSFFLTTLLAPLGLIAVIALPLLFLTQGHGERNVVVMDQTADPLLFDMIKTSVEKDHSGTTFRLVHEVVPSDADMDQSRAAHSAEIESRTDSAYIVLRSNVLEGAPPEYYASNVTDLSIATLGHVVTTAVATRRLVLAGLDPGRVAVFTNPVEMKTIKVSPKGEAEDTGQAFAVVVAILMTVYITIMSHSGAVLYSLIEEKSSRIVEVLITSVEPYHIMLGKLIGIGLVGLTRYAIWGLFGLLILIFGSTFYPQLSIGKLFQGVSNITPGLLIYCIIFFVLGYLLFATMYLIVGALTSVADDAQQFAGPITLLYGMPLLVVWMVVKDPNSTASVALSLFPIFTPTIMMARIAVGSIPFWQILLSISLMTVTIITVLIIASKVYRAGILLYGKRITLAEAGHWLRYS